MRWLLLEDDEALAGALSRALVRQGNEVVWVTTTEQALALGESQQFERAVFDLKLENHTSLAAISPFLATQQACELVVLTGYASIPTAVQAVKDGARNYLCKPISSSQLLAAFEQASPSGALDCEQPMSVDRLEWEHIQRVLLDCEHNISATARALGMHRRTLQRKLAKKPVRR